MRKPDTLRESVKRAKRIQEYGAKPLGMEVANELDDLAHKIGADEELFEELDKRYFVVEQLGKGNEREVAKFDGDGRGESATRSFTTPRFRASPAEGRGSTRKGSARGDANGEDEPEDEHEKRVASADCPQMPPCFKSTRF